MIVITCPRCHSTFRFDESSVEKPSVKMRCSVCSHIFTHTFEPRPSIEEEFDSLISQKEPPPEVQEEESPLHEEVSSGIEETTQELPQEKPGIDYESEVQPESVIREIDSILGKGEEITPHDRIVGKREVKKRKSSWIFLVAAVLAVVVLGGLWVIRDSLPFLAKPQVEQEKQILQEGPFFSIPEESITYELLTNPSEGTVLVIKGVINKLTQKPLQSALVQARVYNSQNRLIDTRSAYAGIVPDTYEFTRQNSTDIDALLNAEPASTGVFASSQELPFAIAFYGKPAEEGASFQVEVKEFHWK
ncbi:MAG: zinc-ribbon domain-containing protein [Desulfomonilia bacterium]